jgi:ribosomal protein S15P/S13E
MKFFTSLKNLLVYSLVLLVSIGSLLFAPPIAIATPVDFVGVQSIIDTTGLTAQQTDDLILYSYYSVDTKGLTVEQTVEQIDQLIAYYRGEKKQVSESKILTVDTIKEILKDLNAEINNLIAAKKALLGNSYYSVDTKGLTVEQIDQLIAYYRGEKKQVSESKILTVDTIKEILKDLNAEINNLIAAKKALLGTTS